eukprot:scaffold88129_cov71-Phaeocystis_antarctica.AAC.3
MAMVGSRSNNSTSLGTNGECHGILISSGTIARCYPLRERARGLLCGRPSSDWTREQGHAASDRGRSDGLHSSSAPHRVNSCCTSQVTALARTRDTPSPLAHRGPCMRQERSVVRAVAESLRGGQSHGRTTPTRSRCRASTSPSCRLAIGLLSTETAYAVSQSPTWLSARLGSGYQRRAHRRRHGSTSQAQVPVATFPHNHGRARARPDLTGGSCRLACPRSNGRPCPQQLWPTRVLLQTPREKGAGRLPGLHD